MTTMTVNWVLPNKRTDGAALPIAEIKESEVALSSDGGLGYVLLGTVPNGTTQTFNKTLTPGNYKVRVTVIDTNLQRGVPSISDAVILPAPPAAPVVTVTIS